MGDDLVGTLTSGVASKSAMQFASATFLAKLSYAPQNCLAMPLCHRERHENVYS
jgi:hypothetical protein